MKHKTLWITCFEKIGLKKNFEDYIIHAKPALKKYKVKIKFASNNIIKLEGKKFERVVCLEFKNSIQAKKFFNSPEYKNAKKFLKRGNSIRNLNLVNI